MNEQFDQVLNKYVIVRVKSANVFAGKLEFINGSEVVLGNARKITESSIIGTPSLSQLATEGFSQIKNYNFHCPVIRVQLFNVIEIIETTEKAATFIKGAVTWGEGNIFAKTGDIMHHPHLSAGQLKDIDMKVVEDMEKSGWIVCDGRALLREKYPALFATIGDKYGAPDEERFNIPDLRPRGMDSSLYVWLIHI